MPQCGVDIYEVCARKRGRFVCWRCVLYRWSRYGSEHRLRLVGCFCGAGFVINGFCSAFGLVGSTCGGGVGTTLGILTGLCSGTICGTGSMVTGSEFCVVGGGAVARFKICAI